MILEIHLFWGKKFKNQDHEEQINVAGVGHDVLVSAGFF